MSTTSSITPSKYRMVAFDLDGTLLGPDHQISDYSVQYIRSLHNKGFLISIATGRSAAATAQVIRRLNLQFPRPHSKGFPLVTTNGARGIHVFHDPCTFQDDQHEDGDYNNGGGDDDDDDDDGKDEKKQAVVNGNPMVDGRMRITELFHLPVPMDLTVKTLNLAKSIGCVTNYYIDHDIYAQVVENWHLEATKKYSALTGVDYVYCQDDYKECMDRGLPSKLLVLCRPESIDEIYTTLQDSLGHEAKVIRGSPPFFVEVLNQDVNKGTGLELLCDKLGVGIHECISFGDGDNDIEFIQKSGLGIAMKNARDTVKEHADAVTDHTNVEDGAIRMLQRLESEGRLHFLS
jgi:Cof subfamily protein (haloacid dehalogenase superfamily)